MKIRVVSDLHVDINGTNFDKLNDLLLIAGDTAGSCNAEIDFLKDKKFIAVGGNHLGYEYQNERLKRTMLMGKDYDPTIETKQDCIKRLTTQYKEFPQVYLENNYIKHEGIIIFGGTMYSDYNLYKRKYWNLEDSKETTVSISKDTGRHWLNDFRRVYTKDKKIIRPMDPDDYVKYFRQFKKALKKCLEETTEDIIVVTHFCPSKKSISPTYRNDRPTFRHPGFWLNASYASNLENFIKKNPRIKLWACGHCHWETSYKIGDCTVVMAPYGYYEHDTPVSPQEYEGKLLDIQIDNGKIISIQ